MLQLGRRTPPSRALACAALWALPALAGTDAPQRREAVVLTPVEDMYTQPDASVDVTSQAFLGQVVAVLESRAGFSHVETPDRYRGWLRSAALKSYPDGAAPRYAARGRVAEVVSLIANVYREPSVTSAKPKSQAPFTARLEVQRETVADKPGWLAVTLPSGEVGYVQSGDVKLVDAQAPTARATPQELVATARRFTGLPYLWGGMTPWGVDCSGFVGAVYRAGGVVLPRDADLQFDDPLAEAVEKDALQAGDLLFFGKKKISHVGMYVGDGVFIHATTHQTPRVQESRLDEAHWTELYRGARRRR
jgi:cell wall-associated NlpC family hydrolase